MYRTTVCMVEIAVVLWRVGYLKWFLVLSLSECYVFIFKLQFNILLTRPSAEPECQWSLVWNSSLYFENCVFNIFLFLCNTWVFLCFTSNKTYFYIVYITASLAFPQIFHYYVGSADAGFEPRTVI